MIVSGFDTPMPNLQYIVGTVSDHILTVNGEEISLRDLCGRNSLVRFVYEAPWPPALIPRQLKRQPTRRLPGPGGCGI